MESEPHIDALWEDHDMGTPKDTHEITRDPNTWEPLEETGLIPTTEQHKEKENPWDNPFNKIPSDDNPETPTLH